MSVVYDAGVLVAADRNDRRVWADHRARLELGLAPISTAPVVAQVSRSARQVQLRRFLRGCTIEPFRPEQAHHVGALLEAAGTADIVDAHLIVIASTSRSTLLTSDPDDLNQLSDQLPARITVRLI